MQFWKGAKYIRIGTVQGFCICNVTQGSGYVWIWLNYAWINCWLWQGCEYDWSKFHKLLNMNASEQQDSEFARVTQCAEYVLKCLIMPKYIRINSSRYARILNVSDAVQSVRSLYKLLSSYWIRRLFRHCHRFKMECITKRIMPECWYAIFQEVSWN